MAGMGILMLENGVYPLLQQPLYHLSESRENSPRKFVVQTCRYLTRIHILHCYFSWQDETHLCHKTNLYPYISSSLFFYFFFLFSNAFFCSLANLRSTFFTSWQQEGSQELCHVAQAYLEQQHCWQYALGLYGFLLEGLWSVRSHSSFLPQNLLL